MIWGLRPQTPDTLTRGAPTPRSVRVVRSRGSLTPSFGFAPTPPTRSRQPRLNNRHDARDDVGDRDAGGVDVDSAFGLGEW